MDLKLVSEKFNTEAKCISYLEELRWGKTKKPKQCLDCGSENIRFDKSEKRYACNHCKHKFSVTTGTIFEHTRYKFTAWFKVITLILNAKQGISAANIWRNMQCSYKTVWYLAMRIRCAMVDSCIEGNSKTTWR